MRRLRAPLCVLLCLATTACGRGKDKTNPSDDPTSPLPPEIAEYVAKLSDKAQAGKALAALEKLGNPAAIPILAARFRTSRDGQFLKTLLRIAHDPAKHTLHPSAIPVLLELTRAVRTDKPDSHLVDRALHAAVALADAQTAEALAELAATCRHPAKHRYAQRATVGACRALGRYKGEAAFSALVAALDRGTSTKSPAIVAAAARSLGQLGEARALDPLIDAMLAAPAAFDGVREALVAMGPGVVPRMMAVFAGVDPRAEYAVKTRKISTGQLRRQAALMLGDLYVTKAVPHLVESLKSRTETEHHEAVFVALTQIADASAAPALLDYALDAKRDTMLRVNAIGAYGVLAGDARQLPRLLGWLAREQNTKLRNILAITSAHLVRDERALAQLRKALPAQSRVNKVAECLAAMGALCGEDVACLLGHIESLPRTFHASIARLPGVTLTAVEVAKLKRFADVRALTDVVKFRHKHRAPLPVLIRLLATASPHVQHQLLYALVHTAPRPCPQCAARLYTLAEQRKRLPPAARAGMRAVASYLRWAK